MQDLIAIGVNCFFNGRSNKLETNPVPTVIPMLTMLSHCQFQYQSFDLKIVVKPLVVCNFSLSFYYCLIMHCL